MAGVDEPRLSCPLQQAWSLAVARLGLVLLALLGWELGTRLGFIDPFYFSTPSRVLVTVIEWAHAGFLFGNLAVTLGQAATGFLVGTLLGIMLGFGFAANPCIDAVLQPFIAILNAMPRIAFAPLIILWFGLGFLSKVVIVVSLVFFVVFFNTYRGFKEINPTIIRNARLLGATKAQMMRHIYLPATLAWTFASLRVSVGFAIIVAVLGEYIGASAGIGHMIDNAQANFDAAGVMAGLLVLTVTVALLDAVLSVIERRYSRRGSH